jgi:hypothetical protein
LYADGTEIGLIDGSGVLLLTECVPVGPTVFHQGDGKKRRRRQRRKDRTHALYLAMEETLRRVMDGTLDEVVSTVAETPTAKLVFDRRDSLADAAEQLRQVAHRQHREAASLADLRATLRLYEARLLEEDDEEIWSLT